MYYYTTHQSPVGEVTLACDGDNLTGLWLEGQKYHGGAIAGEMTENNGMPIFSAAKNWLDSYFAGEKPSVSELRLKPDGSKFRCSVWSVLCEIPYGTLVTYGDIAKKIAAKMNRATMSGQAIGGAVGHNPISIIIPCHRVAGSNGSLTGYAGGIGIKRRLLELEGVSLRESKGSFYISSKASLSSSSANRV